MDFYWAPLEKPFEVVRKDIEMSFTHTLDWIVSIREGET